MEIIKKYENYRKIIKSYGFALSTISFDAQTIAPKKSAKYRAEMISTLSGEAFKISTSDEYIEIVNELFGIKDQLEENLKREIEKVYKDINREKNIPKEEYIAYRKTLSLANTKWEEAKQKSDYNIFKDHFKELIKYIKKFNEYTNPDENVYDVKLDDFEEGYTINKYDEFFEYLKENLVPFVLEVLSKPEVDDNFITSKLYDISKQREFINYLLDVFNFDLDRGLLRESVHPFTSGINCNDVRLTVRYLEEFLPSSIFAGIHELGHALYEQQVSEELINTNLARGASPGMHESQSRFYENIIGKSYDFWQVHYKKLQSIFSNELTNVSLEDFYKGINKVKASLIRVEADELTYPLHILIRYEMEKLICNTNISVDELPKRWNDLYEKYLGIRPNNDSEGILQDIHWSWGMFGYFPTYALGSAIASQIYYKSDIDLEQLIKNNEIYKVNDYLKEHLHKYGSTKSPRELIKIATGEDFSPEYYVRYLKDKYSKIYNISEEKE
ncbi:carboxypeptidase M32 [Mycoplasmatota bacterium zrk1]